MKNRRQTKPTKMTAPQSMTVAHSRARAEGWLVPKKRNVTQSSPSTMAYTTIARCARESGLIGRKKKTPSMWCVERKKSSSAPAIRVTRPTPETSRSCHFG